ncbi:unnamed protein product [Urochloa decumbens]|uniref:Uncharacterized protein n=1 Tax=Urochloa decumbens TaxID=240449 RepID=A0ABC9BTX4_9POAL
MAAHDESLPTPPTRSDMDASHGAHVFEVQNYSQHRGLCFSGFLRSSTFRVGGCDWAIRFYPGGCLKTKDPPGSAAELHSYVAVGLELATMDAAAAVSFCVELVDQATGARYSGTVSDKATFDTRCVDGFLQTWCINRLMKRSELESSVFLRDDRIVIECNVRVIEGTRAPEARPEVMVPPSDLPEHLGTMLEEGDGADVTFEVQGESIPAHRAVVASRSPVFKAELHGQMKERREDHIAISDMQPDVFKGLLRFIYTDSLPNMDDLSKSDSLEMARHLLVAADRYAMDRLQLVCARILSKSLDVENMSTTLGLADRHGCSALKDACIEYIISSDRMDDVVKTEGYARLKSSCPSVLVEVLEKASELHKI